MTIETHSPGEQTASTVLLSSVDTLAERYPVTHDGIVVADFKAGSSEPDIVTTNRSIEEARSVFAVRQITGAGWSLDFMLTASGQGSRRPAPHAVSFNKEDKSLGLEVVSTFFISPKSGHTSFRASAALSEPLRHRNTLLADPVNNFLDYALAATYRRDPLAVHLYSRSLLVQLSNDRSARPRASVQSSDLRARVKYDLRDRLLTL